MKSQVAAVGPYDNPILAHHLRAVPAALHIERLDDGMPLQIVRHSTRPPAPVRREPLRTLRQPFVVLR